MDSHELLTDRLLMVLHLITVGMYLKRQALLLSLMSVEQQRAVKALVLLTEAEIILNYTYMGIKTLLFFFLIIHLFPC